MTQKKNEQNNPIEAIVKEAEKLDKLFQKINQPNGPTPEPGSKKDDDLDSTATSQAGLQSNAKNPQPAPKKEEEDPMQEYMENLQKLSESVNQGLKAGGKKLMTFIKKGEELTDGLDEDETSSKAKDKKDKGAESEETSENEAKNSKKKPADNVQDQVDKLEKLAEKVQDQIKKLVVAAVTGGAGLGAGADEGVDVDDSKKDKKTKSKSSKGNDDEEESSDKDLESEQDKKPDSNQEQIGQMQKLAEKIQEQIKKLIMALVTGGASMGMDQGADSKSSGPTMMEEGGISIGQGSVDQSADNPSTQSAGFDESIGMDEMDVPEEVAMDEGVDMSKGADSQAAGVGSFTEQIDEALNLYKDSSENLNNGLESQQGQAPDADVEKKDVEEPSGPKGPGG